MADNHNLKIISFNINGVLNPTKRSKILSKMKKENAQIVLLQETHLNSTEHETLKRMGFSKVYYSSYKSGHRRATGILICGGDWNIRLNPRLDSSRGSTQTSLHKKFKIFMSELDVILIFLSNRSRLHPLYSSTCSLFQNRLLFYF